MTKRLRSFHVVGGMGVIFLVALLVFGGCSNNSPLQPNFPQTTNLETTSLDRLVGMGGSLPSSQQVEDAAFIKADDGGIIEIQRESFVHEFIVDAGAIDGDTEITVKSWGDKIGGKEVIVFEFGPDGLVFSKAAHLRFEIAELNERASSAKLHYFDPVKDKWILQESSQVDNGIAEFPIYHFSKYAISD
jgi:hypothetical protein